jgi:hypothetical protein
MSMLLDSPLGPHSPVPASAFLAALVPFVMFLSAALAPLFLRSLALSSGELP